MHMNITNYQTISDTLNNLEPAMKFAAHSDNRPFMPLLPTLRAYALSQTDWTMFRSEYISAVDKAVSMGYNFAVVE